MTSPNFNKQKRDIDRTFISVAGNEILLWWGMATMSSMVSIMSSRRHGRRRWSSVDCADWGSVIVVSLGSHIFASNS